MKTPRFRATATARRAHGLRNRPAALAFVIGTAAWVAAGWAGASVYQSVALIWSVAGGECADVPLTLDGDDVWSGAAVVPLPAGPGGLPVTIQFQFMVDGSLQPAHYGWGGPGPLDLAFGANPPNVVLALDGGGWYTFALAEASATCTVTPAPGSILATVHYAGGAAPVSDEVRLATRCSALDATAGAALGDFPYDLPAERLPVPNLLPGHDYRLTFTAPGFRNEVVSVTLTDAIPYNVEVTLQKLVPAEGATWGAVKVLYR